MKTFRAVTMKTLIHGIILIIFAFVTITSAASNNIDKVFIKEYTYNASDDDSKNSARKKALIQLKTLLSEEVGTHIESSLNIKQATKNGVSHKYVKNEISSLSASITKLKIIDEEWDGITYQIKASVQINEQQTMQLLLEAIKSKASEKDIKRLNSILSEQNKNLDNSYVKIQQLQKKLVEHEITNQASKRELDESKKLLDALLIEKKKYDLKLIEHKNKSNRVKKLVKKARERIKKEKSYACLIHNGMTKKEVEETLGQPTAHNNSYNSDIHAKVADRWNYGAVTIVFTSTSLVKVIYGCS